ncbi:MAG: type II toxin-antitoxin system Phd/YefM family antitoxin [Methylobacter sp.]|nr:type II toxin-antitoxin system Phd/YefM family antitoxin [Methylobacter sp.]
MSTLQVSEDILPLGHFKSHAADVLRTLNRVHRPIVITQNGKPTGVLLSPEEFDRLQEQASFLTAVRQGLEDDVAGRVVSDKALGALLNLVP